jgi:transcriptional regulator of met regulon
MKKQNKYIEPVSEYVKQWQDVNKFIRCFKSKLDTSQIKLLKLLSKNIYGIHLQRHAVNSGLMSDSIVHECVFNFEHEKSKGDITIRF